MSIRRMFLRWLPVVVLALTTTLVAAPTAQADVVRACPAIYPTPSYCLPQEATRLAPTSHIGWVHLNLNYCPQGAYCFAGYRSSTPAWSWNGSAWSKTTIAGGWVYVYPYTGSWRWAWTEASGWVAMDSGRFEIRRY